MKNRQLKPKGSQFKSGSGDIIFKSRGRLIMNYEVLAREIQKLGYAMPDDVEDAKKYVEHFVQKIEEERNSGRFEALVQKQSKTTKE